MSVKINFRRWIIQQLSFKWRKFHYFKLTFYYNDVNNQQDATTFSFIILFNSALHVSGDKFAHLQEHVLTVYTVKKCSWRWAILSTKTCRAELRRLINEKVVRLVGYLHRCTKMMRGHTNINLLLLASMQFTDLQFFACCRPQGTWWMWRNLEEL